MCIQHVFTASSILRTRVCSVSRASILLKGFGLYSVLSPVHYYCVQTYFRKGSECILCYPLCTALVWRRIPEGIRIAFCTIPCAVVLCANAFLKGFGAYSVLSLVH